MAKRKPESAAHRLTRLLLDNAYAFSAHRGLQALLDELLGMWGVRQRSQPSAELLQVVPELVDAYGRSVREQEPFADVLGAVYMELASHGQRQWLAQFFSPANICDMSARMLLGRLEPGRLTTVCDPACGSGAMLLAACREVLATHGANGLRRISVTGIDLDPVCADMAAVQLVANCNEYELQLGEIRILRGDALGDPGGLSLVVHATARDEEQAGQDGRLDHEETADAL
jgi:type I restriction-modification system DNA methylase subunit